MAKKICILVNCLVIILANYSHAEKYAVLITGEYADSRADFEGQWALANNYTSGQAMQEFWNDTFLMWDMLLEKGFSDDNIYVLFANGNDYTDVDDRYKPDAPYAKITDFSATKDTVEWVFNGLANGANGFPQLTKDDFLVVWFFDHGNYGWTDNLVFDYMGEDGNYGHIIDQNIPPTSGIRLLNNYDISFLCWPPSKPMSYYISNWNNNWLIPASHSVDIIDKLNTLFPDELDNLLDSINAHKKVVLMQQCFGGGFIDVLEDNDTIILTASGIEVAKQADQKYKISGNTYEAIDEHELQSDDKRYKHGEFDFHLLNAIKAETPDFNEYYETAYDDFLLSEADMNDDGIVTLSEAKQWVIDYESVLDYPRWSDKGNIGSMTSLEYPTVLCQNVTSSMTVRSEIAVTKTITISSGATLIVMPGSTIKVKSGKTIIIYGSLIAEGTSSKPIVFEGMDGNWEGIELINAGNSSLKYCEIKNAHNGIYIYNCDPYIEQCYIHDNTFGCYVDYTSSPVFYLNTLSDNRDGIRCYNSCTTYFGEPHELPGGTPHPGNNRIINNNRFGIYASNNCSVFLGMDVANQAMGGYNSICGNSSYEIFAKSGTTVNADWNWWNTSNPSDDLYADGSSSIYFCHPVPSDPGGGSSLAKATSLYGGSAAFDPEDVDENNPKELLQFALYYKYSGKLKKSVNVLETIIQKFPETVYAVSSLVEMFDISRRSSEVDIEAYCKKNIADKYAPKSIQRSSSNILVSKYMREGNEKLATELCNEILNSYSYTESEKYALFNLFLLAINGRGKLSDAAGYIDTLKEKYPNDPLTLRAMVLLGEDVDWSLAKHFVPESESSPERPVPEKFKLLAAYPNPFNLSTTITFNLPEASKIELNIYDILGRQIWSWPRNNSELPAGNYQIVWNAANLSDGALPSGVYFIRFYCGWYHAIQKVILMK